MAPEWEVELPGSQPLLSVETTLRGAKSLLTAFSQGPWLKDNTSAVTGATRALHPVYGEGSGALKSGIATSQR